MNLSIAAGTIVGGDFRVERPLRSGGMGAVYVVTQLSTDRLRALKVMSSVLAADEGFVARFTREAKVSGRIASDHVVEVVGAGFDVDLGAPWMAMELLEGEELGDYLRRSGALGLAETTEILSQACHAIGAAHRAGIVHRDLKPENLFLSTARRRGSNFTVKVLDFGIAKVMADVNAGPTAAMGSPLWMAPEQATRGASIAPETDVWALGLIAFRMLAGHPYWLSVKDPNSSVVMLTKEILFDPLEPAETRADGLPHGFDAWFARCVVREPSQRFRNADQALAAFPAPSLALSTTQLDTSHPGAVPEPTPERVHEGGAQIYVPPVGSGSAPLSFGASGIQGRGPTDNSVVPARPRRRLVVGSVAALAVGGLISASVVLVSRDPSSSSIASSPAGPRVSPTERDDAVVAATELKKDLERDIAYAPAERAAAIVADLKLYAMLTGTIEFDASWAVSRLPERLKAGVQRYFVLLAAGDVKALKADGDLTKRASEALGRIPLAERIDRLLLRTLDEGKSWLPTSLDAAFEAVTLSRVLGDAGTKQIQSRSVRAGHGPVEVMGRYTLGARPLVRDRLGRATELLQFSSRFTGVSDAPSDIEREAGKLLEEYTRDYVTAWRSLVDDIEVLPPDGIKVAVSTMEFVNRPPYPVETIARVLLTNLKADGEGTTESADLVTVAAALTDSEGLMNTFHAAVGDVKQAIDAEQRQNPGADLRGLAVQFDAASSKVEDAFPSSMNIGQKALLRKILLTFFQIAPGRR